MKNLNLKYLGESDFVNALRRKFGINKPLALPICCTGSDDNDTCETWETWETHAKSEKPIGYFLTETLPDTISDIYEKVTSPYYNFRYWVRNRFLDRLHYLDTDLNRGQYYDLDTRILHGLFNSLKDFVEGELAQSLIRWDNEARKKYKIPFFARFKSKEAGLEHLKWGMSLVYTTEDGFAPDDPQIGQPTHQAKAAREQWILYHWWENYLIKEDPFELWHAHCDAMREKYKTDILDFCRSDWTKEEKEYGEYLYKVARAEEDRQDKEVEEMTIRLMKIRRSLWT